MIDPDVGEGQCTCRGDDNAMSMGHAHYCVRKARHENGHLPHRVAQVLIEAATDDRHKRFRIQRLAFNGDTGMRDGFVEALRSPDMTVQVDQCEDDPEEICVRASGKDAKGSTWSNMNIILLDPWWSKTADLSTSLAEDIVTHWDRLKVAAADA